MAAPIEINLPMAYGRFDTRLQHSLEAPASQPLTVDEFESHVDSGPYSTSETIQKAYAINYSPTSLPNFQSPSYSTQEMIPVEYVGSTSLSERDPCRRKSALMVTKRQKALTVCTSETHIITCLDLKEKGELGSTPTTRRGSSLPRQCG
ncbi:hypothetical protein CIHG_09853 [Coccidioides immitis H538.4]|uniref:Uncharacterized protein n=1 Tax=Coccidioides immitis H538.4 TaxID=396776 RepID=A0A0J8S6W7_COCIT|nr:hypothetical protein CIHG_09853 [Coccidioides immitis H538.4]